MERKRFVKRAALFLLAFFFVTVFNISANEIENNSDSAREYLPLYGDPYIHIHSISDFTDLQNVLGTPYYQIIAKALDAETAEDIKYAHFFYPHPYFSNANIKQIIILDKDEEINNKLLKNIRDQIFSEIIRYEKFLVDKTKKKPHLPTAKELFINGIKVFTISGATYYSIYGHTTGYEIALWKEGAKLIFCQSTFPQGSFLKEYAGGIPNLLNNHKIEEYEPLKFNKNQRKALEKKLEYISDFLEALK